MNCCDETIPAYAYVGRPAPDFSMDGVTGTGEFTHVSLTDSKGKWTVLFFYPLDFTFICPTEIKGFSQQWDAFATCNAVVYGISTDSKHSHKAWLKDLGELKTPLLSDMTHEVSESYGVLIPEQGIAMRGTFIIDPDGVLKYASINDNSVGRSIEETLRVLKALQTGELCPVNWKAGENTLGKA